MTHLMNRISQGIRYSDFSLFGQLQVHRDLWVEIFFFRVKIDIAKNVWFLLKYVHFNEKRAKL